MAGQTRQQLNDPQVARLSGEFFQRKGDVALVSNADVRPNDDGRGIATRFINQVGLTNWSAHFRYGETTGPGNGSLLNYAWQPAPLGGAPPTVSYVASNDYLRLTGGAGTKHFLSRAIPNAAGSWQNKDIYARMSTGSGTTVGIRIDNGATHYVELCLVPSGTGSYTLTFRYSDGGGAASSATTAVLPIGMYMAMRLLCFWNGATYAIYGYLLDEVGAGLNIGYLRTITGNWAAGPPVAGRAGVFVENAGNLATVDWLWNTLV